LKLVETAIDEGVDAFAEIRPHRGCIRCHRLTDLNCRCLEFAGNILQIGLQCRLLWLAARNCSAAEVWALVRIPGKLQTLFPPAFPKARVGSSPANPPPVPARRRRFTKADRSVDP